MSQRNNDECQFAVNMFKSTESSLKRQLDLLQKAIDDRKSFRSLNLLSQNAANRIGQEDRSSVEGEASPNYSNFDSRQRESLNIQTAAIRTAGTLTHWTMMVY